MYIAEVHFQDFRSLQNVQASLQNYNCLIGKNDCGKSSFLRALKLLFDSNTHLSKDDICLFEEHTEECFIEATLMNCGNHEFEKDGVIKIRRRLQGNNSIWEYKGQSPCSEILKKMSNGTLTRTEYKSNKDLSSSAKELIDSNLSSLAPSGKVSKEVWQQIFVALRKADMIEYEDDWCSFERDKLSELVQVVMLEADVRGEEELTDDSQSVFGYVAGILLRDALRKHNGMKSATDSLRQEIQQVTTKTSDGKWLISEINHFETILREEIATFDGKVSADSELIPPKVPPFEFSVRVGIRDEWVKGLEKMGHGLRRSVVFSMLRAHRRLKIQNSNAGDDIMAPLYLFLVEEPELYLHPQAERKRKKELLELSSLCDAQVVLSTHSAIFADLNEYRGILRFSRPERKATVIRGWMGEDLDPTVKKDLTAIYQLDPNKSSMLFADHVILVEGPSEKIAVPFIAEKIELDTNDKEVVDCGGNGSFPMYQRILEGFGIKYVAWLDDDDEDSVNDIRKVLNPEFGRIVLTPNNWEDLTGITLTGRKHKLINSWTHFVHEKNQPNEETTSRVKAAYNWEDYE